MQPALTTFIAVEPPIVFPGMTVMQLLMSRSRSAMRKAAAMLAAMQIVLVATPLAESGGGSTSAHIEASGVQTHYAHNEGLCIACAARKMFDDAAPADASPLASSEESDAAIAAANSLNPAPANGPPRSRAPPSTLVG
ncbi:MAG TPA: hypothetical protein VFH13_02935 [Gemmatimonadaceae bacterium]|nr:hypothetical protein [Gemmatimonadaceae bacterium]